MKLTQPLTREHLPAYWAERHSLFTQSQADLSELNEIDSIGLAFLVQWSQAMGTEQQALSLLKPPASFYPLADLYGVNSFFELTHSLAGCENGTE